MNLGWGGNPSHWDYLASYVDLWLSWLYQHAQFISMSQLITYIFRLKGSGGHFPCYKIETNALRS